MEIDLRAGIVRILKPDGMTAGTGFVVSKDGLIVTCSHVVQDEESQQRGEPKPDQVDLVFQATGNRYRARVEPDWWRPVDAEDVAILRLDGALPRGVERLALGRSANPVWQTFSTFGFPESKPVEGLSGKCEVIGRTTENGFSILQLRSDEVSPGFSGAPVCDRSTSRAIGMIVSILAPDRFGKQRETAFITPSETLAGICPLLAIEDIHDIQMEARLRAALRPLNYTAEINSFLAAFHGRKWFFEAFDTWLAQPDAKRFLLITGPPGVGKSALASSICGSNPAVAACHFCQYGSLEKSSALRCIQSLAHQLSSRLSDYQRLLLAEGLDELPQDARSAFDRLITQPLGKIAPPDDAQVIVIDALDEAEIGNKNELVDVLASEFDKTPAWLRLVATTRSEASVLNRLSRSKELEIYDIQPKSAYNLDDIRVYARAQLTSSTIDQGQLLEVAVNTITDNSEGLFLIAEIMSRVAREDLQTGRLSFERLAECPRGLAGMYVFYFERYFPDLTAYQKYQRPLLELVVAAKAPLPLELAAWILKWDEYELDEVLEPLGSLFPEIEGTISPFHKSVVEWLGQRRQAGGFLVAKERGKRRLAEACWQWQEVLEVPARSYLLRYGFDYLLDQDCSITPPGSQSLELCEKREGAFLLAAVEHTGVQWMEERMRAAFTAYFEAQSWAGVAKSLLYLRLLHQAAPPIRSALKLLTDPTPIEKIDRYLLELERIADKPLQLAIALLAATRLISVGDQNSSGVLFQWASQHEPRSLVQAQVAPILETVGALLTAGPLPFARQLVESSTWFAGEYQFRALVAVWIREPTGPLHSRLVALLKETLSNPDPAWMQAIKRVARRAVEIGDTEAIALAFQWIGACSSQAGIETLELDQLLRLPQSVVVEVLASLCENVRLRQFHTIRAAACAMILMGSATNDSDYLAQMVEELAQVADVQVEEICAVLVEHIAFAFVVWGLSPAGFYDWLSARLPLMMTALEWSEESSADKQEPLDLFRKLVGHLCIVLRWVAAQSEGTDDDKKAVDACLEQICRLAWLDPANWSRPFVDSEGEIGAPLSALDPLRANTCWQTGEWLAQQGWLPWYKWPLQVDLVRAASHEIVHRLFDEVPSQALDQIETALTFAWRGWLPSQGHGLEGSPWLHVLRAISAAVGVSWQPAWASRIPKHRSFEGKLFPDRLDSYLRHLRKRTVEIAEMTGWYPELLRTSVFLAFIQGDESLDFDELKSLLVPALAAMDAALLTDLPNAETWPPRFLPILCTRVVPQPFADAIGSLELCDRGMLWQVSQDMCRRGNADWWESVRQFRDSLWIRVLRGPTPRVIWYKREEPAQTFLDAALAPINLLLDEPSKRKDFDELADEVNWDPDSSCARLKQCLRVNPRPELLAWSVEEFAHRQPAQALWLIGVLVSNSRWDLLQQLLEGLYGERSDQKRDDRWLSGFVVPEKPISPAREPEYDWRNELEEALGIGPEEGLIYRLAELARQSISGELFGDDHVLRLQARISLANNWERRVADLFHHPGTRQKELIRTLLVVAMLSQNQEAGLLAERLAQESNLEDELGPELLWVGRAAVPDLVRQDRILTVATSGQGLGALVSLTDWEAVRLHLQSYAKSATTRSSTEDPLAEWYRACESFDCAQQLACLQIYNEAAPQLLGTREENKTLDLLAGDEIPLLPISEISSTLAFSEYVLSQLLVKAAHYGNTELVREWFRAMLIEAQYGSDRKVEIDRLETLYRCAGVWLAGEEDLDLRAAWIESAKELARVFNTRSVWNSFFGGVGMCLEEKFGDAAQYWLVREDYGAVLALAEELTRHGTAPGAESFWRGLFEEHSSPWLAIRACSASLARGRHQEWPTLTREFCSMAWQLAQESPEIGEPRFLANITEYAIRAENSGVLQLISDLVAKDRGRAASLGRIALDVFLGSVADFETDRQAGEDEHVEHWLLVDLPHITGMRELINSLVDQAAAPPDGEPDIGLYDHTWWDDDIRTGLGWLKSLLEAVFKREDRASLLTWIGSWITRIRPERDKDWTVCKTIADSLEHAQVVSERLEPLLDFAISSLGVEQGELDQRINLTLSLATVPYCVGASLQILDQTLDMFIDRGYSVDRYLGRAAVVCVRTLRGSDAAERYLQRMTNLDEKAVVEDEIAEMQKVPLPKRVQNLANAPQTKQVREQMGNICLELLDRLTELDRDARKTLAPVLVHLRIDNSRLDEEIASSISHLLDPEDWHGLEKHMEHIKQLGLML